MFALGSRIIGTAKTAFMDIQVRFSAVLKVSKVVKWSRIFVRSIRSLLNFRAIPIINLLMRIHDIDYKASREQTYSNNNLEHEYLCLEHLMLNLVGG